MCCICDFSRLQASYFASCLSIVSYFIQWVVILYSHNLFWCWNAMAFKMALVSFWHVSSFFEHFLALWYKMMFCPVSELGISPGSTDFFYWKWHVEAKIWAPCVHCYWHKVSRPSQSTEHSHTFIYTFMSTSTYIYRSPWIHNNISNSNLHHSSS